MAKVTTHVGADGLTYRYLRCPECEPRCRPLGAIAKEDAEALRQDHERRVHGRQPRRMRANAATALEDFYASRRADGKTQGTVDFYRGKLPGFFAFQGSKPIARWTRGDLEAWIVSHEAWSPRQVQALVRACRTFRAWAIEAGLDVPDFIGTLRGPKVRRRRRRVLTPDEICRLLLTARSWKDVRRRRWLEVAVLLAADMGFALGDVRAVTWAEVDLDAQRISRPRAKSGKELWVPMTARVVATLERYRSEFPAIHGFVVRAIPKSEGSVSKAIRELFKAARVPREKGDGLHLLRHTFISTLVAKRVPLQAVADLVGDSPTTLARFYLHSTDEDRREAIRTLDRVTSGVATS